MISVNQETALRDPCCHVFHHGRGYLHVGHPPLPSRPVASPAAASPTGPVADGTWHLLKPPHGGPGVALQWLAAKGVWLPVVGTGNRVAYSPEYLAAHGWVYMGQKV
jgi:hypothetical protein